MLGWTRTHGFFILMGGFHLYERENQVTTSNASHKEATQSNASRANLTSKLQWIDDERSIPPIQPFENIGSPIRPLEAANVLRLLEARIVELPTEQEIADRSKTD